MESDVLKELQLIQQEYIKSPMADQDMILSFEDKLLLDESRRELRAGKARSLDDILRDRHAV